MRKNIKDGEYNRYFVSVIHGDKVVNLVWCSNMQQIQKVRKAYGKGYEVVVTDVTWSDRTSGYGAYQKAKADAKSCGCNYFCKDTLQGTDGIYKMARLTGVTPYEIRRSIIWGWKSHNGHSYEKI